MKGNRPEQALLSRDTDPGKTEDTRRVIEAMVDALNDHRIDDIGEFFAADFVWRGNFGCGTKHGLAAFQDHWQRPFQAAFSDKVAIDEARLYMGEWAACFGAQHAVHSGEFMGIAPTGRKVEIRYMDFWKVQDGKIVENWVSVDFAHVMAQLGEDVFGGHGWETFDRGEREPPRPTAPTRPRPRHGPTRVIRDDGGSHKDASHRHRRSRSPAAPRRSARGAGSHLHTRTESRDCGSRFTAIRHHQPRRRPAGSAQMPSRSESRMIRRAASWNSGRSRKGWLP